MAQPPGKKNSTVDQLSGGEKALTAVALVFSIFLIKPSPFCILDEVDAPLDEANVDRYNEIVREMTDRSQFIVITHNKRTMEVGRQPVRRDDAGARRVQARLGEPREARRQGPAAAARPEVGRVVGRRGLTQPAAALLQQLAPLPAGRVQLALEFARLTHVVRRTFREKGSAAPRKDQRRIVLVALVVGHVVRCPYRAADAASARHQ